MARNGDDETGGPDDARRIEARLGALREPPAFQPDAARGRARVDERRKAAVRRARQTWTIVAVVAALLGSLALPAPRAAAQRLWDLLTVRRVEVVQVSRKDLPADIMNAFELHDVRRDKEIEVPDVAVAERLTRFRIHLPPANVLSETPRLVVTTTQIEETPPVDTSGLRRALTTAGVNDLDVPEAWEGARVRAEAGPLVSAQYAGAELSLTEAAAFRLMTPPGFPVGRFMEMGFRIVGRPPAQARNFGAQFVTNPAWFLVFPSHDTVQEVPLQSGRAILATGGEGFMCFFWNTTDRIYVLGGKSNKDLAVAIANAINAQP